MISDAKINRQMLTLCRRNALGLLAQNYECKSLNLIVAFLFLLQTKFSPKIPKQTQQEPDEPVRWSKVGQIERILEHIGKF